MSSASLAKAQDALAGIRVLVVEDEPIIALDLAMTLQQCGAEVLGPALATDEAQALLAEQPAIDAAVLDVRLAEAEAWPVAQVLLDRQIPFVLTSGRMPLDVPPVYAQIPYLPKPLEPGELIELLAGLCVLGRAVA